MGKKILIAGYPKSGNTWLGYMLSYILGAKYIDLHAPNEKVTKQKEILRLIDGSVLHKTDFEEVCKTHERYFFRQAASSFNLELFDKVILIVRDPRDVAVSYFFFKYCNVPATTNPNKRLSNRSAIMQKILWKLHVIRTARSWANHTISWRAFQGTYLVRYEDLKSDCMRSLQNVCRFLEVARDTAILEDAMELFSFERLSGGRKPGEEYQASFYRKGIVGDYRNYFDAFDIYIMGKYAGTEMSSLDYL